MVERGFATSGISLEHLTRREREVLRLLAQDLSDREIAERLFLSVNSIKWHARRIYEKLGVGSRHQAVKKAQHLGLLPGDPLNPKPTSIHNLPRTLTSLVGRKVEIQEVVKLVCKHRLVTLTGSGGVGKTRLALAAAPELLEDFQDGITYVDLSAAAEPEMVIRAVMNTLGVAAQESGDLVENLVFHFGERQVLLVLNNCEHLAGACAHMIYALLSRLDNIKILATSRQPLEVEGEVVYRVPSLAIPEADQSYTVGELSGFDSIALFLERAQEISPCFQLDEMNCVAVEAICRRLDGIPLAIELAASHCASLGVVQIAERLEHSFQLLTGGTRMTLERHRTLRSATEWSYQMISEPERLLLRRLGIFAGGWTLLAAEKVCSDERLLRLSAADQIRAGEGIQDEEIAGLLGQLVNKSLVQVERLEEREPRYRMLATIQQFALEELYRSGESERLRKRLYEWVKQMASQAGHDLLTGERLEWSKRLRPEHRNLYAALSWAVEEGNDLRGGLEILFQLHTYYWFNASSLDFYKMLQKVTASMELKKEVPIELRVLMYYLQANLGVLYHTTPHFIEHLEQALTASEASGAECWLVRAMTLTELGWMGSNVEGWLERGYQMLHEAEEILRPKAAEYPWYLGFALISKAWVLRFMSKHSEAEACCEEGTQLLLKTGDVWGGLVNGVYWEMAEHAYRTGNVELAKTYYAIERAHCLEAENEEVMAHIDRIMANWEREHSRFREAWSLYQNTLRIFDRKGMFTSACVDLTGMAANLSGWAENLLADEARQAWLSAVRIMAALVTAEKEYHIYTCFEDRIIYNRALEKAKAGLMPEDFEKAWAEGLAMHLKQLVTYAQRVQVR